MMSLSVCEFLHSCAAVLNVSNIAITTTTTSNNNNNSQFIHCT